MKSYRKKPVVIQAVQYLGDASVCEAIIANVPGFVHVETLEGPLRVTHGDYIIRGIKGEYYPCKPDVFDATYDAVDE